MPRHIPAKPKQTIAERIDEVKTNFGKERPLLQLYMDQQAQMVKMRYDALRHAGFADDRAYEFTLAHVRGQK